MKKWVNFISMVEYKMADEALFNNRAPRRAIQGSEEITGIAPQLPESEIEDRNTKLTRANITKVEWISNTIGGHNLYTIEFYFDGPLRAGQTGKVYFKRKIYKTKKSYRDFTKMRSYLLSILMPRRDQWKQNILNSVPFPPKKWSSSKNDKERKVGLDNWLNIWIKLFNAIRFNDHFIQKLNEFFDKGVAEDNEDNEDDEDNGGNGDDEDDEDNGGNGGDYNGGGDVPRRLLEQGMIGGGNRCRKNTKRRKFSKSRKSKRRLKTKRRRR
jgi:hypothetical protein